MKRRAALLLAGILAVVAPILGLDPVLAQSQSILVGAAVSLQPALTEIDALFRAAHPDIKVEYNFANSGSIQQQVEQGAPVDVVFFAAASFMNSLEDGNLLVKGSRQDILTNCMALIVPADSDSTLEDFAGLTAVEIQILSIGDLQAMPAGRYAEEILTEVGVFEELRPKMVFASTVREILTAVEQGNADAGILFTSDAQLSDQVRVVATADPVTPIVYPAALVRDTPAARAYLEFLTTEEAEAVFLEYGFIRL
ncbi:molybdate ABC transporter substrate-binding protein [Synechococcus sp. Nb3U1]|uniref:molybdate ABC transporter substrate-binding protein n=1 Tax=Synechococcus sp. Nb3U1 TaxID=1914529 RepID=UPI001F2062AB|nr:molybdate ABC transporter substrate-binding protein [Synechococcus sp. Nb3U1]MCF2970748.1 molybdate ABC transporter substrate-binding protein [Synechococcus sp. Nb3U1]